MNNTGLFPALERAGGPVVEEGALYLDEHGRMWRGMRSTTHFSDGAYRVCLTKPGGAASFFRIRDGAASHNPTSPHLVRQLRDAG